jgi:hypothetical protein
VSDSAPGLSPREFLGQTKLGAPAPNPTRDPTSSRAGRGGECEVLQILTQDFSAGGESMFQ